MNSTQKMILYHKENNQRVFNFPGFVFAELFLSLGHKNLKKFTTCFEVTKTLKTSGKFFLIFNFINTDVNLVKA